MPETWTTYYDTEAITWQVVRGIARAVNVERDRFALPATEPSETACPRCGAEDGSPCITVGGNALSKPHSARRSSAGPRQCESCSNPARSVNARYCASCRAERDRMEWRMRERSTRGSCADCGAGINRKSVRCKPCQLAILNAQRAAS